MDSDCKKGPVIVVCELFGLFDILVSPFLLSCEILSRKVF